MDRLISLFYSSVIVRRLVSLIFFIIIYSTSCVSIILLSVMALDSR